MILAGHSVGEITASALAGVLTEAEAMTFVRERANSMAAAAADTPTGMSAVVAATRPRSWPRSRPPGHRRQRQRRRADRRRRNVGAAQGPADNPPAKARVMPLKVAGAFHTSHMSPAVGALEALRPRAAPAEPAVRCCPTRRREVTDGDAAVDSLIAQVSRPVRWDLCMEALGQARRDRRHGTGPGRYPGGTGQARHAGASRRWPSRPRRTSAAALALFAESGGTA